MSDFCLILQRTQVAIPAYEVMLILAVLTLCLAFRTVRVGLVAAYIFAYRLGWIFLNDTYGRDSLLYFYAYLSFGVVVVALTAISFWKMQDD